MASESRSREKVTVRKALAVVVALAVLVGALPLAACGGSTAPQPSSRDTSTLAKAIIGHWKSDQDEAFFSATQWSLRHAGSADVTTFDYQVVSADAATRSIELKTFQLDNGAQTNVQTITFTFKDAALTQLAWGFGQVVHTYTDGRQTP
jgi:hypothetical protein